MEGREGALPFVDSKTRFDIPSGHGQTGRSDGSKSGHRRNQMNIPSLVIGLAAGLFIGILACILYRNKKAKDDKEKIANAEEEALRIINDAIKSAESKKREATLEAKEEILRSRKEYEKEEKERVAKLVKQLNQQQKKQPTKTNKKEKAIRFPGIS